MYDECVSTPISFLKLAGCSHYGVLLAGESRRLAAKAQTNSEKAMRYIFDFT